MISNKLASLVTKQGTRGAPNNAHVRFNNFHVDPGTGTAVSHQRAEISRTSGHWGEEPPW